MGEPRPGIDRLACPACGRSSEKCQDWDGGVYPCCGLCHHPVRPCQGNDADCGCDHEFRIVCKHCGERGRVTVSIVESYR